MARISGLVPSRFLTLLAHLVVVITLFWSRVRRGQGARARALLPLPFSSWRGPRPAASTPLPQTHAGSVAPVPRPLPNQSRNPIPLLTFLFLSLSAGLTRKATSRLACLSSSPPRSMRSRTTSEPSGRGERARVYSAIRRPGSDPLSLCRLVAALCLTLGLFAVELAGFLSGVSMFNSTQSLLCILSPWPASPRDSSPSPTLSTSVGLWGTSLCPTWQTESL